jgi:hypothetical protein
MFNAKVVIECMLHHAAKTEIDKKDQTITFYTDYFDPFDSDGYHPPKSLLMDDFFEDLINKELRILGVETLYEPEFIDDGSNLIVETVYIFKKRKPIYTFEEWENSKMTKIVANLEMLK